MSSSLAQKKAKELLAKPLAEMITPQELEAIVSGDANFLSECDADNFFDQTTFKSYHVNIPGEQLTFRHALGILARRIFEHPFLLEETRKEAATLHPVEYQANIAKSVEDSENHGCSKYLALIDALTNLADNAILPSEKVITEGIRVLQAELHRNKDTIISLRTQKESSEALESHYYGREAVKLYSDIHSGKEKPDWMPRDLYESIKNFDASYGSKAAFDDIQSQIKELLPRHCPMTPEDYRFEVDLLSYTDMEIDTSLLSSAIRAIQSLKKEMSGPSKP